MLKRALTYFVLTLVVLQSALAVGDTHQLHQSCFVSVDAPKRS